MRNVTTLMKQRGMDKLGYTYINVDEGWLKDRNATTGEIIYDPKKFPNGMKVRGRVQGRSFPALCPRPRGRSSLPGGPRM
jgi:hypothetical protein